MKRLKPEKTARNISKNTTIVIAAHDFPSFKPAKSFVGRTTHHQSISIHAVNGTDSEAFKTDNRLELSKLMTNFALWSVSN